MYRFNKVAFEDLTMAGRDKGNIQNSNNSSANQSITPPTMGSNNPPMNPVGKDNGEVSCLPSDYQVKSRWYRLRSEVPGLKKICVEKFQSLKVFSVQNIQVSNDGSFGNLTFMKMLQIGFDVNHDCLNVDYKSSSELKLPTGKVLVALDEEELDKDGNFIPALDKKVVIDGLPLEYANKPELLVSVLADYMSFFSSSTLRCLPDGTIYDGRIVLKVKEFKKIPNRRFAIPVKGAHGGRDNFSIDVTIRCFGHSEDKRKRKEQVVRQVQNEDTYSMYDE